MCSNVMMKTRWDFVRRRETGICRRIVKVYTRDNYRHSVGSERSNCIAFASTLASLNLVSSFIELGLNSPIRGNNAGESPLISCIQVTNSMEKGNFTKILSNWLYPDIWLLDKRKRTVFHHLTLQIDKNDSFRFYTTKILEYIISDNNQNLLDFRANILNAQDEDGNTALHLAIEKDSKWFIKVLVDLGADTSISNKRGTKPSDFEIIRDLGSIENDDQIFDLISTGLEFLNKRLEIGVKNYQK